jgi:hypothetical protein
LNDASDWADETCAAEPGRRGRLTLGLVLVLVAVIGVLAYVGLELGAKVVRFASAYSVHTVHSKSSPAGAWALVIDTVDEGALGGSTNVYLKPAKGDARGYTLHEDNWLPDSAVRWRDARTVSIDGLLQMPFVEHAIATGSSGTDGAALDAAGYVHERVVLLSGLSLVLPGATTGELLTRRAAAGTNPWQRLGSSTTAAWSVETFRSRSHVPTVVLSASMIGRKAHGRVVLRWNATMRRIYVITELPDCMTGLVTMNHVTAVSAAQARARATRLWQTLGVKGVSLPSS